jgi:hypothetical protein
MKEEKKLLLAYKLEVKRMQKALKFASLLVSVLLSLEEFLLRDLESTSEWLGNLMET